MQALHVYLQDEEKLNTQGIQLETIKELIAAIKAKDEEIYEDKEIYEAEIEEAKGFFQAK